jgi:hypothetical protein
VGDVQTVADPEVSYCFACTQKRNKFYFTLSICNFVIGPTVVIIMQLLPGEKLYKIFWCCGNSSTLKMWVREKHKEGEKRAKLQIFKLRAH